VEAKYMEVEHFEDKKNNQNKVMLWDNLLPSCKRCNGAKGTHDVLIKPIVNPFKDDPKDEFYFRLYKIKGKTRKGIETEDVININDPEKAVKIMFDIGHALEEAIDDCNEKLNLYLQNKSTGRKNRLLNSFNKILKECQPDSDYSMTCATILHSNLVYMELKIELSKLGFWNNEFQKYHNDSLSIIFQMK